MTSPEWAPETRVTYSDSGSGMVLADDDPRIPMAHRKTAAPPIGPDNVYVLADKAHKGYQDHYLYDGESKSEHVVVVGGWFARAKLRVADEPVVGAQ